MNKQWKKKKIQRYKYKETLYYINIFIYICMHIKKKYSDAL